RFQGKKIDQINHDLKDIFNQCDLFLRVGLSRRWQGFYWLLVSGVYSFPDYLGKEYDNKVQQFDIQNNSCSEINKIDGTIIAQKIISCVSQVGESFGMRHIAKVLCGSKSKKVIYNRHDTLTIYGAGKEYSREQWQDFIKELIQLSYLKSEGEIYPVIKQTQKSRDILSGKERIFLTKPIEEVHIFDENFDRDLFEILRILRKKLADAESIPPYIIFHDSSLKAMATHFPQNPSDFQKISGVGERKLMKYSKLFLEEIISYCKKHKIEPQAINALGYTPKTTTSTLQTLTNPKTERQGVDVVRVVMSKHDRIETLKQIIREFQHDKEAVPLEDIISKAESSGIERDAVEDVIRLLKRTGEMSQRQNRHSYLFFNLKKY
ncbi:MAG: RQC domain-containing protein, partial [Candidatus Methanoperedens sp.]|nr:RQC domain-containing protein [Candidatus Methanoperedens sp.]